MSTDSTKDDTLHGLTVKDLSMLIIVVAVAIFFVTVAIIFIVGAWNSHGDIKFTGTIDLTNLQQEFSMFIGAAIAMIAGALTLKQTLQAQST